MPPSRKRDAQIAFVMIMLTVLIPLQGKFGLLNAYDPSAGSLLSEIVWSLAYLVAARRLMKLGGSGGPLLRRSRWLVLFVGLSAASAVWSIEPFLTFKNAFELAGTTLIGVYFVACFPLGELLGILMSAAVAMALMSLALIFGAPGHGRMFWGSGPWDGLFQDKNTLGAAMALAIITLAIVNLTATPRRTLFTLGSLGLCVALLVGSHSATASVDCVATLIFAIGLLAARPGKYRGMSQAPILIGLLALVGVVFVFGLNVDTVAAIAGRSDSLTGRTDFWPYLEEAIAKRPYLGYGYGAFFHSTEGTAALSQYVIQAGGWSPYHAHDSFLQTALDTGFAGVAVLVLAVLSAFARGLSAFWRGAEPVLVWSPAIIFYLVIGSYTETYFGSFNTLEWMLFVAAALYPLRAVVVAPKPAVPAGASPVAMPVELPLTS
ncbi:MAG: O-antigen ligase family protein [Vulcanimicrobiaceae bacterium]